MILLPDPPRRAHLRAFGCILAASLGIAAALAAALFAGWACGAAAGAVAVIAGAAVPGRERVLRRIYPAWNRAAARVGGLTARAVLVVMFRLVFRAAARMGSPMPLQRPGGEWTLWSPCVEEPDAGSERGRPGSAESGWAARYMRRVAQRPERLWMIGLLPFLAILRWVAPPPGRKIPTETYTLY